MNDVSKNFPSAFELIFSLVLATAALGIYPRIVVTKAFAARGRHQNLRGCRARAVQAKKGKNKQSLREQTRAHARSDLT